MTQTAVALYHNPNIIRCFHHLNADLNQNYLWALFKIAYSQAPLTGWCDS